MDLSMSVPKILRRFCWHSWARWSEPFIGTWVTQDTIDGQGYMSQKRQCLKCGRVSYRKCK